MFTLQYASVPVAAPIADAYGPQGAGFEERLVASTALTGQVHPLGEHDLRVLSSVPAGRWVDFGAVLALLRVEPGILHSLLGAGLLLCDAADGPLHELARREERLATTDWFAPAAHYHMLSRVRDQDAAQNTRPQPGGAGAGWSSPTAASVTPATGAAHEFAALAADMNRRLALRAAQQGPPPPPFHEVAGILSRHALPDPRIQSPLTQLLHERKTIRVFDNANPMTVQQLSTLLYYTYGAQGVTPPGHGHPSLRKTSPSGGSLHPIEAYPLVINVRGQPSGLYHYSVERHMLELLRPMHPTEAERIAEVFVLGQSYFRSANAMFILTARWYRNFWKYPRAHKAYRVVHLDAGHLSQSLYLLCGQLGLGAFFTGAVNDVNIEETLGLDPLEEGVIGISGCGRPLNGGHPLTMLTLPYTPRAG